jgi:uncharacterized protein (TIGR00730 family)
MRVTVFGSARLAEATAEYQEAMRLGGILARRGDVIVSGGYGGIMEAVSRGAHAVGGQVVGVTVKPWAERLTPNTYLSEEVSAETLFQRLEALVESDALIALPGGAGTLGEVALAWNLRQMDLMPSKPVILVGKNWRRIVDGFRQTLIVNEKDLALLTVVETVDDAVTALEDRASSTGEWYG